MTVRLTALAVIVSLSGSSAALAGDTLLESGTRIVERAVHVQVSPSVAVAPSTNRDGVSVPTVAWVSRINRPLDSASLTQEGSALSESGMKRRTKVMIFLAAGVGFAASAWVIDHNVLDITPSSLGQRKD